MSIVPNQFDARQTNIGTLRAMAPTTTATTTGPSLAEVLAAVSDPVRLQIIRTLVREPEGRACGTFPLPVTKSTASHHFKVLREAGLIEQEMRGRTRHTTLRREDIEQRYPGLLDLILRAP
jgi:DNA-binding transcriptional ArsR family regulator